MQSQHYSLELFSIDDNGVLTDPRRDTSGMRIYTTSAMRARNFHGPVPEVYVFRRSGSSIHPVLIADTKFVQSDH